MKRIIVALANQKGGVAKTTTCNVLAAGLTGKGYKVLAVDLDPQGNLSLSAGVDMLSVKKTIYDVFKGNADTASVIVETPLGFDLLPGGLNLAAADMEFTQLGREKMLSRALSGITGYDTIIIDTPPTLGILTANALVASDRLIIPMCADIYSLQGLDNLSGFIRNVHEYGNPDLKVEGLLITKYNGRQNLSRALTEQIEEASMKLGTKVFKARIRESVAVREAAVLQSDLFKEMPKATATIDYGAFVEEFIKGMEE